MGETDSRELVLRVEGMSCVGCEERIGRVLGRLDGVRAAIADHRTGVVSAVFDPGAVAPQDLAERLERAGYRVIDGQEGSR